MAMREPGERARVRSCAGDLQSDCAGYRPLSGFGASHWLAFRSLRTDLFIQYSTRQVDVGQAQRHEGPRCVLGQPAVASSSWSVLFGSTSLTVFFSSAFGLIQTVRQ